MIFKMFGFLPRALDGNVVTDILSTITSWLTGFWTLLTSSITSAVGVFWNTTTGLTPIGILGLFGVGVGLVYLGLNFVMRFFKK